MIRTATLTLTQDDLAQFDRDGFYIARGLFSADEIAHMRDTFMDVVKDGPAEGMSDVGRIKDKADPLYQYGRLMHPHLNAADPAVRDLAMNGMLDQRIHDILHDLLGEQPLAAQSMVYFKPPGARGQDLHQDNFYLRIKPGSCMAAWLALDDCDPDNGGMVVVPGSHKLDVFCPEERANNDKFFTGHHVDVPEGMEEVPAIMKAGDCLFFNGSVIHGSYPNKSEDRFRRAFICHYAPRSCEEASHTYRLFEFDGTPAKRNAATGGGPCGDVHAADESPH